MQAQQSTLDQQIAKFRGRFGPATKYFITAMPSQKHACSVLLHSVTKGLMAAMKTVEKIWELDLRLIWKRRQGWVVVLSQMLPSASSFFFHTTYEIQLVRTRGFVIYIGDCSDVRSLCLTALQNIVRHADNRGRVKPPAQG